MISAHDRVRIAAHIVANPRTVARVYQGRGSSYSRRRVLEAAHALGLPLPPAPSMPSSGSSPSESPTPSRAA
jgi:hypothetical protein